MQIRCIIIDDEPLAIEKLSIFISKVSWLQQEATFTHAIEALNFLKTHPVDLVFLDIQMDEFSGLQFLEALSQRPYVVITSAYTQYAVRSYDFAVTDYLLKPFGFERFIVATDKVFNLVNANKNLKRNYIFVKTGYSMERVDLNEIQYIEGMNEYLQIVTSNHKYITLQNFRNLENLLPSENFIRVHKSYIIALDKIERIERNLIFMNQKRIPIGKSYKERLDRMLENY